MLILLLLVPKAQTKAVVQHIKDNNNQSKKKAFLKNIPFLIRISKYIKVLILVIIPYL